MALESGGLKFLMGVTGAEADAAWGWMKKGVVAVKAMVAVLVRARRNAFFFGGFWMISASCGFGWLDDDDA